MTDERLASRLIRFIAATLLVQLLMCHTLWINSQRLFPTVPLLHFLPVHWDAASSKVLYLLLLVSIVALMVKPFARFVFIGFITSYTLLLLEDITRLQPWLYLYLMMLSPLTFGAKDKPAYIVNMFRLILSSVYFWSGIQKLNPHFATDVFPWFWDFTGAEHYLDNHHFFAYFCASLEMCAGICLWIRPMRKAAALFLVIIHVIILFSLGPLNHNWNNIVWPWNVLFGYMIFELFYRHTPVTNLFITKSIIKIRPVHFGFIFLLASIMPGLCLAGKWDHFLSDDFYSAMPDEPYFYLPASETDLLPKLAQPYIYSTKDSNTMEMRFNYWSVDELNVPVYPQNWVYKEVVKKIARMVKDYDSTGLRINLKQRFSDKEVAVKCSYRELVESK